MKITFTELNASQQARMDRLAHTDHPDDKVVGWDIVNKGPVLSTIVDPGHTRIFKVLDRRGRLKEPSQVIQARFVPDLQ